MNNATRKEVNRAAIGVDSITTSEFQKPGTLTAQLRQVVTTLSYYPSKKVTSNLNGGLFDEKDFGFEEQVFPSTENRIAWVLVPPNASIEVVKAMVAKLQANGAVIYRVLSNQPILDDNQQYAITQGLKTIDDFANTQALRFPENPETIAKGTANKLILDAKGNVQYRKTFFWRSVREDADLRDVTKVYISPELKVELAMMTVEEKGASVIQGQDLLATA